MLGGTFSSAEKKWFQKGCSLPSLGGGKNEKGFRPLGGLKRQNKPMTKNGKKTGILKCRSGYKGRGGKKPEKKIEKEPPDRKLKGGR